jgi:hypothetical protein
LPNWKYADHYRPRDFYAPNPGKTPGRSFQDQRCHLFHLFYQVQIRLGSPNRLKRGEQSSMNPRIAPIGHCSRDSIFLLKRQIKIHVGEANTNEKYVTRRTPIDVQRRRFQPLHGIWSHPVKAKKREMLLPGAKAASSHRDSP